MTKDPAFLFYTSDFLTGTITMTDAQVGQYTRLLCLQHQKGHLTEKDMLYICKSYVEDIFCKFQKDESGLYYNERLEKEINKRKNYSQSRSKNRKGSKSNSSENGQNNHMSNISSSHENHMSKTSESYVQHMENENTIDSSIGNVSTSRVKKGTTVQEGGAKESEPVHKTNGHTKTAYTDVGKVVYQEPTTTVYPKLTQADLAAFKQRIIADQMFLETLRMARPVGDDAQVGRWINLFNLNIVSQGKIWKDFSEYKNHFRNWVVLQDFTKPPTPVIARQKPPTPDELIKKMRAQ